MLQSFRDNLKGVTTWLLVGIIIIPFALFGVDSLFLSGSAVDEVASVNGEGITELRLQQAVSIRKQQMLSQYENLAPDMLDDEQLRGPVLGQLVRQKLLALTAAREGMTAASQVVNDIITQSPAFQNDGRFDRDMFDFNLRRMGYTAKTYRDVLRDEILTGQFIDGVTRTAFITPQELDQLLSIQQQQRSFAFLTVPLQPLLAQTAAAEEEIQAYYDAHPEKFNVPEKVTVEYLELRPELFLDQVEVDENLVREHYQAEIAGMKGAVQKHIAHIQVDAGNTQALAEIAEKLANGADFAVLAREYSTDLGTADQGGDLGVVVPGSFPEAFEEAMDALTEGQVSEPVAVDGSYHIIKLLQASEIAVPDFDQEAPRIRQALERQLALELLPEKVETLKELSYNVDTLQTVAQTMGLSLQVSQPLPRTGGDSGLAAVPQAVRAAYSAGVLDNGYSSEVLEIAEDYFLVLKLKQHLPAHRQPLNEVRDEIVASLRRDKATQALVARGDSLRARIDEGESLAAVAAAEQLDWLEKADTRRFGGTTDGALLKAVFGHPEGTRLPVTGLVPLAGGDLVVYALTDIKAGDPETIVASQRALLSRSLAEQMAGRELQAYVVILEASAKIARKE